MGTRFGIVNSSGLFYLDHPAVAPHYEEALLWIGGGLRGHWLDVLPRCHDAHGPFDGRRNAQTIHQQLGQRFATSFL